MNTSMDRQLGRTFNPKYTHYMGDGQGRDAFIIYNNGGLTVNKVSNYSESTQFFGC
jgi:hypothetical protein